MWHFRFLGNLSAERDGVTVTLTPRKYTALLAFLVLHPARRWSRDELAARFWPDSDDETGRAALRTALSTLRKTFGPDLIETSHADTVGAAPSFTTDAAQFETLLQKAARSSAFADQEARLIRDALSLCAGPLLPGIYDDWAVGLRERLETARKDAEARRAVLQNRAARETEQQAAEERILRKEGGPAFLFLPLYNSSFVGREAELAQIAEGICGGGQDGVSYQRHARLWTLTGPGGMGKTRIAVEVAKRLAPRFSGAVCFVPLAALTGGEEIGGALLDALQMNRASEGTDPLQQVLFRLDDLGPSLLILDNLEQMVEAGTAPVVRTLLARLPQVTIIATSRRPIGVDGEQEFPLSPLAPDACAALFSLHARAVRPDYAIAEPETLRALCDRLEGIPLAVELCAPWVRVLTHEQMLHHLDDRFRLLTSHRRDVPSRHRSLHAALEWGCPTDPDLLGFFAALSVFRGGFSLAAAEAVGGENALEWLAALREQSLVIAETGGQNGTMRYRMLETIREFAGEKLSAAAQTTANRRSLAHFKQVACDLAPRLATKESARYFTALEAESPNFRAAIEFGLDDTTESLLLARHLMEELRWFWGIRGHRPPYDEWRRKACARRDELPEPHRTYLALQYAAYFAPDADREPLLLDALQQFITLGDGSGIVYTHERLAFLYQQQNRFVEMETAFRTSAQIRREGGDLRGYGYTLANLGGALSIIGRIAEARMVWQECREISVGLEDLGSVAVLDRAAGAAYLTEGRVTEALPLLQSAAQTFRHKGETWQLMDTLCHLGQAHREAGHAKLAREAWGEALVLARQCGDAGRAQHIAGLLAPPDAIKNKSFPNAMEPSS